MSERKPGFETRITRALDEEVARLDGATRSRLRQARARALDSMARRPAQHARWWLPAGAALASIFLAVVLWRDQSEPFTAQLVAPTDFELLSAEESLELYQDLDFYLWLEREARGAG
jgi:hypothetical protein